MKNDKLIYSIGSIVVIIAALMKILHLPYATYANSILIVDFGGMSIYQTWHVAQLKKRIKELEDKVGI